MKNRVKTPSQALVYLFNCTLATIGMMAMKKSKSNSEFKRQIEIAQCGIDWIKDFNVQIEIGPRIYDVLALPDQKVETWSKSFNCH